MVGHVCSVNYLATIQQIWIIWIIIISSCLFNYMCNYQFAEQDPVVWPLFSTRCVTISVLRAHHRRPCDYKSGVGLCLSTSHTVWLSVTITVQAHLLVLDLATVNKEGGVAGGGGGLSAHGCALLFSPLQYWTAKMGKWLDPLHGVVIWLDCGGRGGEGENAGGCCQNESYV